jgi:hypothetical protein
MTWTCLLCGGDEVQGGVDGILEHLRVIHPGTFEQIQRWPDGGVVIYDELV